MSVKEFNTHIITKLLYLRQQQEQAFKSQASWGRLELKTHMSHPQKGKRKREKVYIYMRGSKAIQVFMLQVHG